MKTQYILLLILIIITSCTSKTEKKVELTFEEQVEDYIKKFPYQDTYEYALKSTGGGMPELLNKIPPKY